MLNQPMYDYCILHNIASIGNKAEQATVRGKHLLASVFFMRKQKLQRKLRKKSKSRKRFREVDSMKLSVIDEKFYTSYERKTSYYSSGLTEIFESAISESSRYQESCELIRYRDARSNFNEVIQPKIDFIVEQVRSLYSEMNDIPRIIEGMIYRGTRTGPKWEIHRRKLLEAQIHAEFEKERIMRCINDKAEEHRQLLLMPPPFADINIIDEKSLNGQMVVDYMINQNKDVRYNNYSVFYNGVSYPIEESMRMMLDIRKLKPRNKECLIQEQKERKRWYESREAWRNAFNNNGVENIIGEPVKPNAIQLANFVESVSGKTWEKRHSALNEFMGKQHIYKTADSSQKSSKIF